MDFITSTLFLSLCILICIIIFHYNEIDNNIQKIEKLDNDIKDNNIKDNNIKDNNIKDNNIKDNDIVDRYNLPKNSQDFINSKDIDDIILSEEKTIADIYDEMIGNLDHNISNEQLNIVQGNEEIRDINLDLDNNFIYSSCNEDIPMNNIENEKISSFVNPNSKLYQGSLL
jgi:hypothetical protein